MLKVQCISIAFLFYFLGFSTGKSEDILFETPVKPDENIKKMQWTEKTALLPPGTTVDNLKNGSVSKIVKI